ncbi:hypothetical protein ES703_49654 [subsurface metagenome]
MVFISDRECPHRKITQVLEQHQFRQAIDGMILHHLPFLIIQLALFIQNLYRNIQFPDIMEKSTHPQLHQLTLLYTQSPPEAKGQNSHVDRVVERVLLEVFNICHTQHERLIKTDHIDNGLNQSSGGLEMNFLVFLFSLHDFLEMHYAL